MSKNLSLITCFLVIASFNSATAATKASVQVVVEKAQSRGLYSVGVGSEVSIQSEDPELSGDSVFLGEAVQPDKSIVSELFLNKKSQKVFYVDAADIAGFAGKKQPLLNPYEQAGGTCTGYAINGFMQQMNLSGFKGNGSLADSLKDEKGRTTLLVDNINEYYLTPQHQYSIQGILNKYGRNYGFKCKTFKSDTYDKVKDKILDQLNSGQPVLIAFNIGPDMNNTPFPLVSETSHKKLDNRIWTPRKIGERNSGGHSIVLAASFDLDNKTYLITIDSDWSEPRVWDMESILNNHTALDEVEVTSCDGQ
ncbi:MAG: hypothetical protein ACXWQQ_15675 [Pseudobdellovibrio sp.]